MPACLQAAAASKSPPCPIGSPARDGRSSLLFSFTGELRDDAKQGSLWLADYLISQIEYLKVLPTDEVLMGRISWAPFEPQPATEA